MLNLSIKVFPLKYDIRTPFYYESSAEKCSPRTRTSYERVCSFCGRADVPGHIRQNEYPKKESY